jgi:hypothetical protein
VTTKPTRRGPGRPTALTPEFQERYVAAIRRGLSPNRAAALCGVADSTVTRWKERAAEDPDGPYAAFFVEVHAARATREAELLDLVHAAAEDLVEDGRTRRGDWRAAAWVLERQHGYTREQASAPQVTIDLGSALAGGSAALPGRDVIDASEIDAASGPDARVRRLRVLLSDAIASRSHQAVAALERQLTEAEKDLAAHLAKAGGLETLPEEEYLARLRIAADGMPEPHLRIFAEAWLDRHRLDTVERPQPEAAT